MKQRKSVHYKKNNKHFVLAFPLVVLFLGTMYFLLKLNNGWEGGNVSSVSTQSGSLAEGQTTADARELDVYFLDVGQGDSTLIIFGDEAMLIDGGERTEGERVLEYLEQYQVSALKYLVGTHPHADHIGSLASVIEEIPVEYIIMTEAENDTPTYTRLLETIEAQNMMIDVATVGMEWQLGEASFVVMGPENPEDEALNNTSIVLRLVYGDTAFLFTGDAEMEEENQLMAGDLPLESDVLKVGHHGSSTSSQATFLKMIDPTWAVISCGEDNAYGHPHAEVLERLEVAGIHIFRTDLQGTIHFSSDGKAVTFEGSER